MGWAIITTTTITEVDCGFSKHEPTDDKKCISISIEGHKEKCISVSGSIDDEKCIETSATCKVIETETEVIVDGVSTRPELSITLVDGEEPLLVPEDIKQPDTDHFWKDEIGLPLFEDYQTLTVTIDNYDESFIYSDLDSGIHDVHSVTHLEEDGTITWYMAHVPDGWVVDVFIRCTEPDKLPSEFGSAYALKKEITGTPWLSSSKSTAKTLDVVEVTIDDHEEHITYSEPTITGGNGTDLSTAVVTAPTIQWSFPDLFHVYDYELRIKANEPYRYESYEASINCRVEPSAPYEYLGDLLGGAGGDCEPLCDEYYSIDCDTGLCSLTIPIPNPILELVTPINQIVSGRTYTVGITNYVDDPRVVYSVDISRTVVYTSSTLTILIPDCITPQVYNSVYVFVDDVYTGVNVELQPNPLEPYRLLSQILGQQYAVFGNLVITTPYMTDWYPEWTVQFIHISGPVLASIAMIGTTANIRVEFEPSQPLNSYSTYNFIMTDPVSGCTYDNFAYRGTYEVFYRSS